MEPGEIQPQSTQYTKNVVIFGLALGFLILLAFLGIRYILSSPPPLPATGPTDIITRSVNYYEGTNGYLALPRATGVYPALILIHEWWGLNDDIRALADRYARSGYVALAVDLYGTSTTDRAKAQELSQAVRADVKTAFSNLNGALSYLQTLPEVRDEHIASVGWCFGGGWSYQMAVNDLGVRGSVMYYGQFDPEDDFEHMKTHILGHFGEKDTGIKVDTVKEFQAKLNTHRGVHDVFIYPNVGHGFANQRGGTNITYDGEAAELAWRRTIEFLTEIFSESESITGATTTEE